MQFLHRFIEFFFFVFSLTTSGLFIILDTVATDTPAYSATSTMVAIFIPFSFSAIPKYFLPEFYSFIIKNRTDICPVLFILHSFFFCRKFTFPVLHKQDPESPDVSPNKLSGIPQYAVHRKC